MLKRTENILIILLICIPANVFAVLCSRYPLNTISPKSPVDENFVISITGNTQTYALGQTYNMQKFLLVSLSAYNGRRFISAKVVLEYDSGDTVYNDELGDLEVSDPVETRFSPDCRNMIESTNTNPKSKLDMFWVAPSKPGAGCILIRATVLQHRDVWFMDDGALTKRVCEESVDDVESQKRDDGARPCCACDEARFEITFEGVWSRNLHPKDFPAKGWITRFSDILGAAHTSDYRFWDAGIFASEALKEFAEHGSPRSLEAELNQAFKNDRVRTILKARGPAYPYMNVPSVTAIRVDPLHHQLSIASKIQPSPDWIVGITGLELCLANCTWIDEKTINLYPWDIGTDAGPSYTSSNQPQVPPDVIRRIRSDSPSDPRSPFYDETGESMKHMATLKVKRLRLYEKRCTIEESNNDEGTPRECLMHPWSDWSECSADCGEGKQYRTRVFKQPDVARIYNCKNFKDTIQVLSCNGRNCPQINSNFWPAQVEQEDNILTRSLQPILKSGRTNCLSGQWSEWSPCNATCGAGFKTRRKQFTDPIARRECQDEMYEYEKCFVPNLACRSSNYPTRFIGDNEDLDANQNEGFDNDNTNFNIGEVNPLENNDRETSYNYPYNVENEQKSYKSYTRPTSVPYDEYEPDNSPYGGRQPDYTAQASSPQSTIYTFNDNESQMHHYLPSAENLRQEPPYEDYNVPETRYSNKNNYFQYLRGSGNNLNMQSGQQRSYQTSSQGSLVNRFNNNAISREPSVPQHCYRPLTNVQCSDKRVVANSWFYNFCRDECMLYASDICDRNSNRFRSLEQCEQQCALPMRRNRTFLREQQNAQCPRKRVNQRFRDYRN